MGHRCSCHRGDVDQRLHKFDYALPTDAGTHQDVAKQISWFSKLYSHYIPFTVRQRFEHDPAPLTQPEMEEFPGVVAFIDISGFTRLSEELSLLYGSNNGAEMLNELISQYFKRLIDVIVEFQGDIIKFAGDAMLVLFRNTPTPHGTHAQQQHHKHRKKNLMQHLGKDNEHMTSLMLRAIACTMTLLHHHNNFQPTPSTCLQLHTGISAGTLYAFYVGGYSCIWDYFIAGPPIASMSACCQHALNGQVVVDTSIMNACAAYLTVQPIEHTDKFIVQDIIDTPRFFKYTPPDISAQCEEALEGFVSPIIKTRMDMGFNTLWISEYRRVYIYFILLPAFDYSKPVLPYLQQCVYSIQQIISEHEGTLQRLLCDDKGTRLKVVFGMPTRVHDDDGVRAVLSALQIATELHKLSANMSYQHLLMNQPDATSIAIGIACGNVFCGLAGSDVRCEYTAVGFKVVLAARLMQAAHDEILVEEEVYLSTKQVIQFEQRPSVKLKGIAHEVAVYRPVGLYKKSGKMNKVLGLSEPHEPAIYERPSSANHHHHTNGTRTAAPSSASDTALPSTVVHPNGQRPTVTVPTGSPVSSSTLSPPTTRRSLTQFSRTPLIGRVEEKQCILNELRYVSENCCTRIVLIEGEGGVGKSALVYDVLNSVEEMKIPFYYGVAAQLEKRTPYYVWRSIFEQILQIDNVQSAAQKMRIIEGLHFEDAENLTLQLTQETRSKNLQRLLVAILGDSFFPCNEPQHDHEQETEQDVAADSSGAADATARTDSGADAMTAADGSTAQEGMMVRTSSDESEYTCQPRVLVLDNAQCFDSGSWELLVEICQLLPSLLIIITTQPLHSKVIHLSKLMRQNFVTQLTLFELSRESTVQLMRALFRFTGTALPQDLQDDLYTSTKGHPLLLEELCRSMLSEEIVVLPNPLDRTVLIYKHAHKPAVRKTSIVHSNSMANQLPPGASSVLTNVPDHLHLADSVLKLMMARIDRLPIDPQLTVKICAVIGLECRLALVHTLHPAQLELDVLRAHLDILIQEGIMVLETSVSDMYAFKNGMFKEAAYAMLSLQQRSALHSQLAHYYETTYTDKEREPYYALLVHHSMNSDQWKKALSYCIEAGTLSLSVNASHEAVKLFELMLQLTQKFHDDEQRAHTLIAHMNLGNAFYAMGRYRKSIEHLEHALELLNVHVSGASIRIMKMKLLKYRMKWLFTQPSQAEQQQHKSNDSQNAVSKSSLHSAIVLLSKLSRCHVHCSLFWTAIYTAFTMLDLACESDDTALLALAFGQCSILCWEAKWKRHALQFVACSHELYNRHSSKYTPLDRARISYQDICMFAYQGEWTHALNMATSSRCLLLSLTENKLWREVTWFQGLVYYFMNRWKEAKDCMEYVEDSANADGDVFYENMAVYWKTFILFLMDGASLEVDRNIQRMTALGEDWSEMSEQQLPLDVLRLSNQFYYRPSLIPTAAATGSSNNLAALGATSMLSPGSSRLSSTASFSAKEHTTSPSLDTPFNVAELCDIVHRAVRQLGHPPNSIPQFPVLFQLTLLTLDVLNQCPTHKSSASTASSSLQPITPSAFSTSSSPMRSSPEGSVTVIPLKYTTAQTKTLLSLLDELMDNFSQLLPVFSSAMPYYILLQGHVEIMKRGDAKRACKLWKHCVVESKKKAQTYPLLLAYYQLASHCPPGQLKKNYYLRCIALAKELHIEFVHQLQFIHMHAMFSNFARAKTNLLHRPSIMSTSHTSSIITSPHWHNVAVPPVMLRTSSSPNVVDSMDEQLMAHTAITPPTARFLARRASSFIKLSPAFKQQHVQFAASAMDLMPLSRGSTGSTGTGGGAQSSRSNSTIVVDAMQNGVCMSPFLLSQPPTHKGPFGPNHRVTHSTPAFFTNLAPHSLSMQRQTSGLRSLAKMKHAEEAGDGDDESSAPALIPLQQRLASATPAMAPVAEAEGDADVLDESHFVWLDKLQHISNVETQQDAPAVQRSVSTTDIRANQTYSTYALAYTDTSDTEAQASADPAGDGHATDAEAGAAAATDEQQVPLPHIARTRSKPTRSKVIGPPIHDRVASTSTLSNGHAQDEEAFHMPVFHM